MMMVSRFLGVVVEGQAKMISPVQCGAVTDGRTDDSAALGRAAELAVKLGWNVVDGESKFYYLPAGFSVGSDIKHIAFTNFVLLSTPLDASGKSAAYGFISHAPPLAP